MGEAVNLFQPSSRRTSIGNMQRLQAAPSQPQKGEGEGEKDYEMKPAGELGQNIDRGECYEHAGDGAGRPDRGP